KEFLGLIDLGLDVVDIRLGMQANFLELLLVRLRLFLLLLFLLEFELAKVHDFANGGLLQRRDLDEILTGLARHLQGLRGRDDPDLLSVGADQADGADANVLVDPRLRFAVISTITIKWRRQGLLSPSSRLG